MKDEPRAEVPAAATAALERRAVVRIDAQPGGKRFQGVWLEFPDGKKWVVAYRPRHGWRWFEDQEVLVEGACYEPFGQAIMATHFRVDRMRMANAVRGAHPYVEIGPELDLRGEVFEQTAPAGSKLAGTTSLRFRDDDGTTYPIVGDKPVAPGALRVRGRICQPDMSHTARTSGPDLWILDQLDPDHEDDPAHADRPKACP